MTKVDKFSDQRIAEMYELYSKSTKDEFQNWAIGAVDTHLVSNKEKKESFKRQVRAFRTKDQIVMFMTNVAFAGSGFGVVK